MYVGLPSSGCNILTSDSSFVNYSTDDKTRTVYRIYEGVAHMESSESRTIGTYDHNGTCLSTGDLLYDPASPVHFIVECFFICLILLFVIYNVIIKRLMP